jgi:hypothetical protein
MTIFYDHLKLFEFDFDRKKLLEEALVENDYDIYQDTNTKMYYPGWKTKKIQNGFGLEICNFFKKKFNLTDVTPRFYIQDINYSIGLHKDIKTLCSINILLGEKNDSITFTFGKVNYRNALLNTQELHGVIEPKIKRYLYKISIYDKTYREMREILPINIKYQNQIFQ